LSGSPSQTERPGDTQELPILLSVPRAYTDYTAPKAQIPFTTPGRHFLVLRVQHKTMVHRPRYRLELLLSDRNRDMVIGVVWGNFGDWDDIDEKCLVFVEASMDSFQGSPQLRITRRIPHGLYGQVAPVYKSINRPSSPLAIRNQIENSFDSDIELTMDILERATNRPRAELAAAAGFGSLDAWLRALHFPDTMDDAARALRGAHTIAAFEVIEKAKGAAHRPLEPRSSVAIKQTDIDSLLAGLRFPPTADQKRAISEICADLIAPKAMMRLLSGDVATGKTVAFAVPAIAASRAGAKVAIMVPATLLVENAVQELKSIDPDVRVLAHVPGMRIPEGDFILVGTQSIISAAKKSGWTPDLMVIDEQHKLSNSTRLELCAPHTNVLEGTATAICRSLALITHGGMDVSELVERPVKSTINTRLVRDTEREKLHEYLQMLVAHGHQIAFVYPLVTEESEIKRKKRRLVSQKQKRKEGADLFARTTDPKAKESIERAAINLERIFPKNLGVIHGRMDADEKKAVIERMKRREINVLAASTVIELGITIPSLKAMVLVNPETLGLAALHQLRGRLARAGGEGICFVYLPHQVSERAMQRYEAFASTTSGFKLAELDLEMRGMGDIGDDGQEQTGATRTLFRGLNLTPQDIQHAFALAQR
jgi:ATP-dependent DNA helicase RecG